MFFSRITVAFFFIGPLDLKRASDSATIPRIISQRRNATNFPPIQFHPDWPHHHPFVTQGQDGFQETVSRSPLYVKGDSMARRKARPIVLSILSHAIPALLIFSFTLVDAANHNRQHRNAHAPPSPPPRCNAAIFPESVILVRPSGILIPTHVRLRHGCRACSNLEQVFSSCLPRTQVPSCSSPPSRRPKDRLPISLHPGPNVVHQGNRKGETCICLVRTTIFPHRTSSSAIRSHKASKYLLLLPQVRLVSFSLVHCAMVHFSSVFPDPTIRQHRTRYGLETSATKW